MPKGERPAVFSQDWLEQAAARLSAVPAPLLGWYDHSARSLPWRENPTPYRVWISEIMLQQTRVEAAREYFLRFVEALPDVKALAAADEQYLLKLWEGLGYYSRARHLQQAARQIVEQHGGRLPADLKALRALPGIGDYSCGSIGSIAFGLRAPAVDGNVLRVISRLLASAADVSQPAVKKALTALVSGMLPDRRVGDFNQALMELGALICLPNTALRCADCPLSALCEGCRQGTAASLPQKAEKPARRRVELGVFRIEAGGRICLRRRPASGLLARLWELPNAEGIDSCEKAGQQLSAWGVPCRSCARVRCGRHVFSHIEWHMTLFRARAADGFSPPEGWVLASEEELSSVYPLPSAFAGLLKKL